MKVILPRSPLACLPCPPGCRRRPCAGYSADFLTLAGVVGGGGRLGNKTYGSRKALVDTSRLGRTLVPDCQECRLGR